MQDQWNPPKNVPNMWGQSKISGEVFLDTPSFRNLGYPQIIHFNRVFYYKPSILGSPYFWKHPNWPSSVLRHDFLNPAFSRWGVQHVKYVSNGCFNHSVPSGLCGEISHHAPDYWRNWGPTRTGQSRFERWRTWSNPGDFNIFSHRNVSTDFVQIGSSFPSVSEEGHLWNKGKWTRKTFIQVCDTFYFWNPLLRLIKIKVFFLGPTKSKRKLPNMWVDQSEKNQVWQGRRTSIAGRLWGSTWFGKKSKKSMMLPNASSDSNLFPMPIVDFECAASNFWLHLKASFIARLDLWILAKWVKIFENHIWKDRMIYDYFVFGLSFITLFLVVLGCVIGRGVAWCRFEGCSGNAGVASWSWRHFGMTY